MILLVVLTTTVLALWTSVYIWVNNRWIKPWVRRKQSEGIVPRDPPRDPR